MGVLVPGADRQLGDRLGDVRETGSAKVLSGPLRHVHWHPCSLHSPVQRVTPNMHVGVGRHSVVIRVELPFNLDVLDEAAGPEVSVICSELSARRAVTRSTNLYAFRYISDQSRIEPRSI